MADLLTPPPAGGFADDYHDVHSPACGRRRHASTHERALCAKQEGRIPCITGKRKHEDAAPDHDDAVRATKNRKRFYSLGARETSLDRSKDNRPRWASAKSECDRDAGSVAEAAATDPMVERPGTVQLGDASLTLRDIDGVAEKQGRPLVEPVSHFGPDTPVSAESLARGQLAWSPAEGAFNTGVGTTDCDQVPPDALPAPDGCSATGVDGVYSTWTNPPSGACSPINLVYPQLFDPNFEKELKGAFITSRAADGYRRAMYGAEVADNWRRGGTPEEARAAWAATMAAQKAFDENISPSPE